MSPDGLGKLGSRHPSSWIIFPIISPSLHCDPGWAILMHSQLVIIRDGIRSNRVGEFLSPVTSVLQR